MDPSAIGTMTSSIRNFEPPPLPLPLPAQVVEVHEGPQGEGR